MKNIAIFETKDKKRIYKIERIEEPIVCCGTTYGYIENIIFDGVVVCQRLLEKSEINFELDLIHADICMYDTTHCGNY